MNRLNILAAALTISALVAGCADLGDSVNDAVTGAVNKISEIADMPEAGINGQKGKALSDRLTEKGECPVVEVAPDLADFYDFSGGMAEANMVSHATLSKVEAYCYYGPKSVTVDAKLALTASIGSASGDRPGLRFPYFAAILSPGGKILTKKLFAADLDFSAAPQATSYLSLRQVIPVNNEKNGASHKVMFGFQLTPAQIDYNRALLKKRQAELDALAVERNPLIKKRKPEIFEDALKHNP